MLIGTLAIAGIPPLAGFFSKDEILFRVVPGEQGDLGDRRVVTALMTAFYMFRLMAMTFFGAYRGPGVGAGGAHAARTTPAAAHGTRTATRTARPVTSATAWRRTTRTTITTAGTARTVARAARVAVVDDVPADGARGRRDRRRASSACRRRSAAATPSSSSSSRASPREAVDGARRSRGSARLAAGRRPERAPRPKSGERAGEHVSRAGELGPDGASRSSSRVIGILLARRHST